MNLIKNNNESLTWIAQTPELHPLKHTFDSPMTDEDEHGSSR